MNGFRTSQLEATFISLHVSSVMVVLEGQPMQAYPAEHGEASNNLAELKCISAGLTWNQSQQKVVDQKAKQIPNLYRNKARKINTKYYATTAGHVGPLEQQLRGFGDMLCLVAGQYGEISQDLHDLPPPKLSTSLCLRVTQSLSLSKALSSIISEGDCLLSPPQPSLVVSS